MFDVQCFDCPVCGKEHVKGSHHLTPQGLYSFTCCSTHEVTYEDLVPRRKSQAELDVLGPVTYGRWIPTM